MAERSYFAEAYLRSWADQATNALPTGLPVWINGMGEVELHIMREALLHIVWETRRHTV